MEWGGWFGYVAFVFVMCFLLPDHEKVKKLEKRIKTMEKEQKGENGMSKLISELVNKECKMMVDFEGELTKTLECTVLDADEEWVKIRYQNKKKEDVVKMIRIEKVLEVNL